MSKADQIQKTRLRRRDAEPALTTIAAALDHLRASPQAGLDRLWSRRFSGVRSPDQLITATPALYAFLEQLDQRSIFDADQVTVRFRDEYGPGGHRDVVQICDLAGKRFCEICIAVHGPDGHLLERKCQITKYGQFYGNLVLSNADIDDLWAVLDGISVDKGMLPTTTPTASQTA